MTIPPFENNGNLPPGIHYCTWDEFVARFETTPLRSRLIQGLLKAMEQLKAAGCRIIYINGSFVTQKPEPNDFDACWESDGVNIEYLRNNAPLLINYYERRTELKFKYKGDIFPAEMQAEETGLSFLELFQLDRKQNRKGIIAIDLTRWSP